MKTVWLLTALCIMTVCLGCAVDPADSKKSKIAGEKPSEFVEIETDDMFELRNWHYTSSLADNLIVFIRPKESNVVLIFSVDNGEFCTLAPMGKNITLPYTTHSISWQPSGREIEQAFVEIIEKTGSKSMTGYAVIEILKYNDNGPAYSANLLKAALIPTIAGEYQAVTQEQVRAAIEKVKESEL